MTTIAPVLDPSSDDYIPSAAEQVRAVPGMLPSTDDLLSVGRALAHPDFRESTALAMLQAAVASVIAAQGVGDERRLMSALRYAATVILALDDLRQPADV